MDLNPPVADVKDIPWNRVNTVAGFGLDAQVCAPEKILSIYSANLKQITAETFVSAFEKMAAFYEQYPDARASTVTLEGFPTGRVNAIPDDSSAYPWRETVTYL
jgi:hypothetical protein